MSEMKQVLIWRKDLRTKDGYKCRTGKIAAQLAHASMKAIIDEGYIITEDDEEMGVTLPPEMRIPLSPEMSDWLQGLFTKICVSVDSEEELLAIYQTAKDVDLHCSLIQDAGLTEFDGVPTYTAVAVGPGDPADIDPITGNLKLL